MDYCPRVNANGRLSMFGADQHRSCLPSRATGGDGDWKRSTYLSKVLHSPSRLPTALKVPAEASHSRDFSLFLLRALEIFQSLALLLLQLIVSFFSLSSTSEILKGKNEWKMLSQYCIEQKFLINAEKEVALEFSFN